MKKLPTVTNPSCLRTIFEMVHLTESSMPVLVELSTALQLIYTTTAIGGSGSRRRVMDILIGLGLQPNERGGM